MKRFAVTAAVLALTAVACSSDKSKSTATTTPGSTVANGGSGVVTAPTTSAGTTAPTTSSSTPVAGATPANFKVAFIGDQGLGADPVQVLNLIKTEKTDVVVHAGDFDYGDDPQAWDDQINGVLGANFPYFASPGNHDMPAWGGANGYQKKLEARLTRLNIKWEGALGEESTIVHNGVVFVLVGPDVTGPGDGKYDAYIKAQLAANNSIWKIACWHKNQNAMQCGTKGDEAGWGVYEESRRAGAIIATGHEHSYSRTHLMSHMENLTVANTTKPLVLDRDDPATAADEGRTFAFVSGLSGRGIRNQDRGGNWWDVIYTSDQAAKMGVLFAEFNYNGDARTARFYFKNVDGQVIDEFLVKSNL